MLRSSNTLKFLYILLILGLATRSLGSEVQPTKSTGQLGIRESAELKKNDEKISMSREMANMTKAVGSKVRFICDITGSPVPTYRWYKDGLPILSKKGRVSFKQTHFGSVLRIEGAQSLDNGAYTCVGQNSKGQRNTTAYLIVARRYENVVRSPYIDEDNAQTLKTSRQKSPVPTQALSIEKNGLEKLQKENRKLVDADSDGNNFLSKDSPGFCEKFRSNVCKKYLGDSSIYVRHKRIQGLTEGMMAKLIAQMIMQVDSRDCSQKLVEATCHFNFPLCAKVDEKEVPSQLCKEDCLSLTTRGCLKEYRKIISNIHGFPNTLLNCTDLPSKRDAVAKPSCIRMSKVAVEESPEKKECYNGRGENYKGTVAVTFTGKNCLAWNAFSGFEGIEGSFCRNPDPQGMQQPWCFAKTGNLQEKEYCSVSKCPVNYDDRSSSFETAPIIAVVGVLVSLSFIALLVCCFWRRVGNAGYTGFKKVEKPQEMQPQPSILPISVPEISHGKIRFGELLGQGLFGPVYRGQVLLPFGPGSPSPVIIKTLQPSMNETHSVDFRREASTLCELAHPNVSAVVGVVMNSSPRCILFETLAQGDLHEYLLYHSPTGCCSDSAGLLYVSTGGPGSGGGGTTAGGGSELSFGPPMTQAEQLSVASQVASALEYLSDHHFVHRDVSARNVVVGDGLQCKLADFAASRDKYTDDYFRAAGPNCASLLPIRWMAPESIMYGKFTPESDMWSFGILLWEVWSFGLQPFFGYSNAEVLKMARSHQILQCPSECPSRVYALMVESWNELPQHRPRAKEVVKRVRAWHGDAVAAEAAAKQHSHSHSSGHTSSTAFSAPIDLRREPPASSRLLPPMGMPLRPPVAPPPTTREVSGASPVPSTLSGDSMEGHSGGTYIPSQGHIV